MTKAEAKDTLPVSTDDRLERLAEALGVRMAEIDRDSDAPPRPPTGDDFNLLFAAIVQEVQAFLPDWEPQPARPTDDEYREAAERLHGSGGEVEIDGDATVSRGDDPGAYVQAWVWVPAEDVEPGEAS